MTDKTNSQAGMKFDSDKPRFSLVPQKALEATIDVLEFGARKYAPENWRKVDNYQDRYYDAAMRHLMAHRRGEFADPETQLPHLAHALCCVLFLLELEIETNARPRRDSTSDLTLDALQYEYVLRNFSASPRRDPRLDNLDKVLDDALRDLSLDKLDIAALAARLEHLDNLEDSAPMEMSHRDIGEQLKKLRSLVLKIVDCQRARATTIGSRDYDNVTQTLNKLIDRRTARINQGPQSHQETTSC